LVRSVSVLDPVAHPITRRVIEFEINVEEI